jgi:hypothetical protein
MMNWYTSGKYSGNYNKKSKILQISSDSFIINAENIQFPSQQIDNSM